MITQTNPPAKTLLGLPLIGNTPILWIRSLSTKNVKIWAKAEWEQPGGSVKARAAHAIISAAIKTGQLNRNISLLDASSGNTAIAYATLLQHLGWKPTICLPANASAERKNILKELGVKLIETSPLEGTDGAQQVAREMYESNPGAYFYADQYSNESNWKAHYLTTAQEIWRQTQGRITHFVAGLGTTGTFTGTSRRLKELNNVKSIALQPDSPLHGLEGWKHLETAHVPSIYDTAIADETIKIDTQEAFDMIKFIAENEGLYISPSGAANLVGASEVASQLKEGEIVTTIADTLDRYNEVRKELFGI